LFETISRLPSEKVDILTSHCIGEQAFDRLQDIRIIRSRAFSLLDENATLPPISRNRPIRQIFFVKLLFKTKVPFFIAQIVALMRTLIQIRRESYDVLIAGQVWTTGYIGWLTKRLYRLPYVTYILGEEVASFNKSNKHYEKYLMLRSASNANSVVAISKATREEGIKIGIPEKSIVLIYPGVDCEKFRPIVGKEIDDLREQYGLQSRKTVLTLSRITEQKGHRCIIKAIQIIVKEYPDVAYLIAGEGPERRNLEKLVQRCGLSAHVLFLGEIAYENTPLIFNLCDMFAMPNKIVKSSGEQEGLGLVFLEAAACGKPVIGGNTGGAVDAIIDGKTGFLVNPLDPLDAAEKIKLLLINESLRKDFGREGRSRVEAEFNWMRTAENLHKVIISNVKHND
jgi:phosphatidylinositol alpha-1,6-mannosyltransferase